MIGVGPRFEFLGTAKGGGGLAPFDGTAIADASIRWLEYRPWRAQNAGETWSMQRAADDTFALRFEVRQGDVASAGARSELSGLPFFAVPAMTHKFEGAFLIEGGDPLSSWGLIHQIHHDDASLGDSPPFAVELNTDDTVSVYTRNNAGTAVERGVSAAPIVRDRWYYLSYGIIIPGTTGTGSIDLTIIDDEGNTFLSASAAGLNIGYDDAAFNYVKIGIYIDDQPETIATRWRNVSVAYGDADVIGSTATADARALPTPFFEGTAPTWCWSAAMQCLSAWTDVAYEHETNPLRVDFIYDQSGNSWGLTQATDLTRPLDSRSNYLFAPYFEGGGDFMSVSVSNDTSDLLDATGFYIAAIVHTIGVPANNGAVNSGTVNNNPLIFGENSGARNFGVVSRDNASGTGPWDAQFFVKDAGGEKATHVPASLLVGEPNLIECEHNGTQITMRVNGGAWSTPVTCGAMVATTGFPRIGHCGTSYQGDIIAVATWKTVPSTENKAALVARFNAMKATLGF